MDTAAHRAHFYGNLYRLVREYLGQRYVLENNDPTKSWAVQLMDFRNAPATQPDVARRLHAMHEEIDSGSSATDFLRIAAKCLEEIVPTYSVDSH